MFIRKATLKRLLQEAREDGITRGYLYRQHMEHVERTNKGIIMGAVVGKQIKEILGGKDAI